MSRPLSGTRGFVGAVLFLGGEAGGLSGLRIADALKPGGSAAARRWHVFCYANVDECSD